MPDSNLIKYQRKNFSALGTPRSLASLSRRDRKGQKAPRDEDVPIQTVSVVRDFTPEQGERTLTDTNTNFKA